MARPAESEAARISFDRDYVSTIEGRAATSPMTAPVYNPATGQVIASVPVTTRAQLDEGVAAARRAFRGWAATPLQERQAIVSAIGDRLAEHAEEFMALLTREQGKPRAGAEWEVLGSVAWFHEIARQSLPEETLVDTPERRVVSAARRSASWARSCPVTFRFCSPCGRSRRPSSGTFSPN